MPFFTSGGFINPGQYWQGDGCFRGSFFRTLTMDETPWRELEYEFTIIDDGSTNYND